MGKNSITSNAAYLFFGNVLVRGISAASTILIARHLGAEDYGILSIALAFASVAGYFTDMGLTHTLIREGTKKTASIPVLMSSFFRVRIIFSILTIIASLIIVELLYDDEYIVLIHYLVLIPSIIGSALQLMGAAYYQLIEKMHYTALIRTIASITTASSLILGMIFELPLIYIAPVYGLASVLAGIISLRIVMKNVNIFKGWDRGILTNIFSFTLSGLTVLLLPQIGPIMIERTSTVEEAGLFSAAYRIPVLLYQIPGVVAAAFYPVLFRLGNDGELDKHLDLNIKQLKVMSFLGISMAIPFLFYSEWWIRLLFGEGWERAALPLTILSAMVIIQSFSFPLADGLTTTGRQNLRTWIQVITTVIGITLYYIFGSMYGSLGGAIAAIISEMILFLGYFIFTGKGFSLIIKGGFKVLTAFGAVCIIYGLFQSLLHPLISSILFVLLFVFIMLVIDAELRKELYNRLGSKVLKRFQRG